MPRVQTRKTGKPSAAGWDLASASLCEFHPGFGLVTLPAWTRMTLVSACAGVAVGFGNFSYPAHFRSFPRVASIQAGGRLFAEAWYEGGFETCPYVAGTRFGSWRPWSRILFFCGQFRKCPGLGWLLPVREWRLGAEIFCIPLISEHFRALPPFRGGRLFAGAWYGGIKTCPYKAGTRFGRWRPWGRILLFAGITGHFRALGSRLCGSGGWVRNFFVSRSFPLVSERCLHKGGGRLFAGTWYGGVKTCPYKADTRFGRWRPWGRILFLRA